MSESPSKRPRKDSPSREKPARMPYSGGNKQRDKPSKPAEPEQEPPPESILAMFHSFRRELDDHHDRRERIIKNSRDITANSKKVIFTLQRVSLLGVPLSQPILQDVEGKEKIIAGLLQAIHPADLSGINAWRYQRQISAGMQEMLEATIFKHYLTTGRLLSYAKAKEAVQDLLVATNNKPVEANAENQELMEGVVPVQSIESPSEPMLLTEEDYLLAVCDAVGEMMRWGITNLALTRGQSAQGSGPDLIQDLRSLRLALENLRTHGSGYDQDVGRKMGVMKTCVEKVENAVYGMVVRGSERPSGWVPGDPGTGRALEEIESH